MRVAVLSSEVIVPAFEERSGVVLLLGISPLEVAVRFSVASARVEVGDREKATRFQDTVRLRDRLQKAAVCR